MISAVAWMPCRIVANLTTERSLRSCDGASMTDLIIRLAYNLVSSPLKQTMWRMANSDVFSNCSSNFKQNLWIVEVARHGPRVPGCQGYLQKAKIRYDNMRGDKPHPKSQSIKILSTIEPSNSHH